MWIRTRLFKFWEDTARYSASGACGCDLCLERLVLINVFTFRVISDGLLSTPPPSNKDRVPFVDQVCNYMNVKGCELSVEIRHLAVSLGVRERQSLNTDSMNNN